MNNLNLSTIFYNWVFSVGFVGAGFALWAKYFVKHNTEEIRDQLTKINYALYNDGKTGLINKVDQLIENQQAIKIDVEVMKARYDDQA